MSEATIQILSTPLPNEEPFIGDGAEGELVANTADARLWVFDPTQTPIELGGGCVNKPVGNNLFASNYLEVDVTNPDNLPIPVPDPLNVPPGIYREMRLMLRFVGTPLEEFVAYFDYEVDWGSETDPDPVTPNAITGSSLLVELSSFGPSPYWMGRLLWSKVPPT